MLLPVLMFTKLNKNVTGVSSDAAGTRKQGYFLTLGTGQFYRALGACSFLISIRKLPLGSASSLD